MSLQVDIREKQPSLPDEQAHEANNLATNAVDAGHSREAVHNQYQREIGHPAVKKLFDAPQHQKVLYSVLALAFFFILYWELTLSWPIYEVLLPSTAPWIAFIGCVAIAFYTSAGLEGTLSLFLRDSDQEAAEKAKTDGARKRLYDMRPKKNDAVNWVFHPVTGGLVAILFLLGIYLASTKRVELSLAAKELPEAAADLHIWLPAALYGVEILLGIPTFFCLIWICTLLRIRYLRKAYTRVKADEETLRQAAAKHYLAYIKEVQEFGRIGQRTSPQNGSPPIAIVPPNQGLRRIFAEDYGYDPVSGSHGPAAGNNGSPPDDPNSSETALRTAGVPSGEDAPSEAEQNGNDGQQEDLLNLLHEQITKQNRGI